MAQLATGEKYLQADRIIHRALIEHYDLYIKEIRNGFEYYSLFHRKGTPVTHSFPQYLYIRERDIIQAVPVAKSVNPKPSGQSATLLLTKNYESEILNNNELDTREKIDMTVHCSCQVMQGLLSKSAISENDFEVIRQVGYSFLCFSELILRESEALEILISNLMNCSHSEYTHAVSVSLYSGMLASELHHRDLLHIDNQRLKNLYIGTLLHDLGKSRIKPEILQKAGRLNRNEYEIVKKHPLYSEEMVKSANLHKEAKDVILYHHERWNGGGYPFNISYQSIPPLARIASVCDVFDALTTRREHRPARKPFEALTLMKKDMTGNFYVLYLDAFIQLLGRGTGY